MPNWNCFWWTPSRPTLVYVAAVFFLLLLSFMKWIWNGLMDRNDADVYVKTTCSSATGTCRLNPGKIVVVFVSLLVTKDQTKIQHHVHVLSRATWASGLKSSPMSCYKNGAQMIINLIIFFFIFFSILCFCCCWFLVRNVFHPTTAAACRSERQGVLSSTPFSR